MAGLAGVFPLLVVLTLVILLVLLFRLDRRLSRGSVNAGPREPVAAEPPGLSQTPWELQAIEQQLRGGSTTGNRADLVRTVNRLIVAAGLTGPASQLPARASDHEITVAVAELERRLELGPLPVGSSEG